MKLTEKLLLDNYNCCSNNPSVLISTIKNQDVFWSYRRGRDGDGYNPVVEDRMVQQKLRWSMTVVERLHSIQTVKIILR